MKGFWFFLYANIQIFWRMKIVKMANNMSQWAIAKKLGISKSDISEVPLQFQGTGNVSDQPKCSGHYKQQYRMVQKLMKIANI